MNHKPPCLLVGLLLALPLAIGVGASVGWVFLLRPRPAVIDCSFPLKTAAEVGARLFAQRGCIGCHSTDGTPGIGPTAVGMYGSRVQHFDGSAAVVDNAYFRTSILYPQRDVVKGYGGQMSSYAGAFSEAEGAGDRAVRRVAIRPAACGFAMKRDSVNPFRCEAASGGRYGIGRSACTHAGPSSFGGSTRAA